MVRFLSIILLTLLLQPQSQTRKIRVAVAANAQFVARLLKEAYEKEVPATEVELIIGSSGKLATQIKQGAPFDVFLSADNSYPAALHQAGLTQEQPRVYAFGTLIIWTTKNLDLSKGIGLVADARVKKIAIANAQLAPYGQAALQALSHYKLNKAAKPKLVYAESIAQVNQYVLSGAADLGFTSKSVVLEPNMKGKGKWIPVAATAYPRIAQSAVLLKSARNRNYTQAQRFYNFLYSSKAKAIFKKYGYATN
jgi:molybdate transport system substrate-binding protein